MGYFACQMIGIVMSTPPFPYGKKPKKKEKKMHLSVLAFEGQTKVQVSSGVNLLMSSSQILGWEDCFSIFISFFFFFIAFNILGLKSLNPQGTWAGGWWATSH